MKFLIDECLHTSLVEVAQQRGHEAQHVIWLGLSGATDWKLMQRIADDDFTFVTNNAVDFRKLYARQAIHAGLLIIVPAVSPTTQRDLFNLLLDEMDAGGEPINEAIEIRVENGEGVLDRYSLPTTEE